MPQLTPADLENNFPFLLDASSENIRTEFFKHAVVQKFSAGQTICREGDVCSHLAVVLAGTVRVYKIGESGREITLYRIEEGDSCVLTASCILSQARFPALAVVESEVQVVLIPAATLRLWMREYEAWQVYVFKLMSQRMSDLIATVEEVAFRRVDLRIAEYLLKLSADKKHIAITHQEIAYEVGTAREVVSRILKDFERAEIISQSRGLITIHNPKALQDKSIR